MNNPALNRQLNEQIRALRATLNQAQDLDADTRAALLELQHDIERHGSVSIADRLEALAVRFEGDHPTVGNAIRQAIDALSKAGI